MSTMRDHAPQAWIPTTDQFGARLAMVRWREGWNAKEAALACGLPQSSWRDWEAGAHPRDMVGVCRSIAERTGADFYWLLAGETPTPTGDRPSFSGQVNSDRKLPRPDSIREPAGCRPLTQAHLAMFTEGYRAVGMRAEKYFQSQRCNKQAA